MKEERIIAESPAASIPVPKEEKAVPRYVSIRQIESLLNQPDTGTTHGLRDRALIEMIYSAGLRISEALGLQPGDIDYEQGFVFIRHGKGGKSRNVPIGNSAIEWLKRHMDGRRNSKADCRSFIFLSRDGEPLSRQSAAAAFRAYARSAGLPACLVHSTFSDARLRNAHAAKWRKASVHPYYERTPLRW